MIKLNVNKLKCRQNKSETQKPQQRTQQQFGLIKSTSLNHISLAEILDLNTITAEGMQQLQRQIPQGVMENKGLSGSQPEQHGQGEQQQEQQPKYQKAQQSAKCKCICTIQ